MKTKNLATIYAIVAAALYAINIPFSKLLLGRVEPTMMAAFLYLGAGLGMFVYSLVAKAAGKATPTEPLTKKELPAVKKCVEHIQQCYHVLKKNMVCNHTSYWRFGVWNLIMVRSKPDIN